MKGTFDKGDIVDVIGINGQIGKGEVTYSSRDLALAIGKSSGERSKRAGGDVIEVIHREKWVTI